MEITKAGVYIVTQRSGYKTGQETVFSELDYEAIC